MAPKKYKIAFISNVANPIQVPLFEKINNFHEVLCLFSRSNKENHTPDYWDIELPGFCKVLEGINNPFHKDKIYSYGLKKELDDFNPEIVWLNGSWQMGLFYQAYNWAVKNKKYIISGPMEFSKDMYKFTNLIRNHLIWRIFFRKIDLFLTNADIHTDYLSLAMNFNNVVQHSNLSDVSKYLDHVPRSYKKNLTFMYGGAYRKGMGLFETLDCVRQIKLENYNINFIMSGFGPLEEKLRAMVNNDAVLSEIVSFKDVKSWDEIPDVYAESDVIINLAEYSPCGAHIPCGIMSGAGIISSHLYMSTRLMVITGYNGFKVNNTKQTLMAMRKYFDDDKLLELHSLRNKEIGKGFSQEIHIERFNEILECYL